MLLLLSALPAAVVAAGSVLADSPPGWVRGLGEWVAGIPGHLVALWHAAGVLWWPWAPVSAAVAVAATAVLRLAQRAAWRRVAAGGYWVAITPPSTVDPARWGLVWRRLAGLAGAARGPWWRLARPSLVFEVYGRGRVLAAGLWLPGWVPYPMVAAEVGRAWPGSTVEQLEPPLRPDSRGRAVAGVRLVASRLRGETGWLVDDPRPRASSSRLGSADPVLGGLWSALAEPGAPVLVQVLVRPATRRRLAWLMSATRHPAGRRCRGGHRVADGVLGLLLAAVRAVLGLVEALISTGSTRSSHGRSWHHGRDAVAPDPVEREAMAEARAKLADRPHLLVTVRVGAVGDRRGQARAAARSVADGFQEASRWLHPVRLAWAGSALRLRRARRGEWLLLSANELGVLAHLPPDPALYRFVVTALHRTAPAGVARPVAELPGETWPGWNRDRWTPPPGDTQAATRSAPARSPAYPTSIPYGAEELPIEEEEHP